MGLDLEGRVLWPSSVHSPRRLNVFPVICIFQLPRKRPCTDLDNFCLVTVVFLYSLPTSCCLRLADSTSYVIVSKKMKTWMTPKRPVEPTMMTQLILEAMTEKEIRIMMMARETISVLHMLLWMTSLFPRQPADIWDNALDPKVLASAQADHPYKEENGKCQGKCKGKGKGKFLLRPSCLPPEDR